MRYTQYILNLKKQVFQMDIHGRSGYAVLEDRMKQKEEEVERLSLALEKLQASSIDRTYKVNSLELEKALIDLNSKTADLETLKVSFKAVEAELQLLKKETLELNSQLAQESSTVSSLRVQLSHLEQQSQQIHEYERIVKDLSERIKRQEETEKATSEEIQGLGSARQSLKLRVLDLERDNRKLEEQSK